MRTHKKKHKKNNRINIYRDRNTESETQYITGRHR